VKKLPRRPSNFPEGGIFKGQAPLKKYLFLMFCIISMLSDFKGDLSYLLSRKNVHLFWEDCIYPYLGVSKNFMFRPTMINIKIQSEKLVIKENYPHFMLF